MGSVGIGSESVLASFPKAFVNFVKAGVFAWRVSDSRRELRLSESDVSRKRASFWNIGSLPRCAPSGSFSDCAEPPKSSKT